MSMMHVTLPTPPPPLVNRHMPMKTLPPVTAGTVLNIYMYLCRNEVGLLHEKLLVKSNKVLVILK